MPLLLTSEFGSNSQRGMSGLYVINKKNDKNVPRARGAKSARKVS